MRTFYAIKRDDYCSGGLHAVLAWAQGQITDNCRVVKIVTARGGEKEARVVAEVTIDGIHIVSNGRIIALRNFIRG